MSHKHIMVVEDDDGIRRNVVEALELEDYTVYKASNGKEALELLMQTPDEQLPSCIVLDLMMPIMDGEQFLNELTRSQRENLRRINVIIGTAKGSPLSPAQLSGAVDRLQKPFDLDQLYRMVQKYSEGSGFSDRR